VRCTWRRRSSKFGDALGVRDQVELKDALGGRDGAGLEIYLEAEIKLNSEMHLVAVIERVWRCTWWRYSSIIGDTLGGHHRVNIEMH
jgi:hypothetical protein